MEEKQEMTFETAIARLEEIVRMLESGNAPLDKSLAMFEEGVSLVKLCNSRLDNAEQKVKMLTLGENGTLVETDMTNPK
ncbi:MAG: exodeoxyribonuclease VII small subunit [Eubacteriales bacterium]